MRPTARSLVLDLLSALPEKAAVPVGALINAASVFGIEPNGVRVAITRLRARGLLDSDERGLYRLGDTAAAVGREVQSWRTQEDHVRAWDGSWVAIYSGALPRADRRALRRRERVLAMRGFRTLEPGLEIRPNNLAGDVSAERRRLLGLGMAPDAPVFRLSQLDEVRDLDARALWDADALCGAYRSMIEMLEHSSDGLGSLLHEAAMAESFELGGEAIRLLVIDPLLPDELVPQRDRRKLVRAIRRYDRLGRRFWKGWTGVDSISLQESPAHSGGGALGERNAVY